MRFWWRASLCYSFTRSVTAEQKRKKEPRQLSQSVWQQKREGLINAASGANTDPGNSECLYQTIHSRWIAITSKCAELHISPLFNYAFSKALCGIERGKLQRPTNWLDWLSLVSFPSVLICQLAVIPFNGYEASVKAFFLRLKALIFSRRAEAGNVHAMF